MPKTFTKYNIHVPFTTVDGSIEHLPFKISDDAAMFSLLARDRVAINPGEHVSIKCGIKFDLPDIVETVVDADKQESHYSKLAIQMNLHTSHTLITTKGITVLSPTVLPASYKDELILVLQNVSKGVQTIQPGEELAIISFTLVPRISLNFVQEPKGIQPYVI